MARIAMLPLSEETINYAIRLKETAMTEAMFSKLNVRCDAELLNIAMEIEKGLAHVNECRVRFGKDTTPEAKAETLDDINRAIRLMKGHINESVLAYIAGRYDGENGDLGEDFDD